MLAQDMSSLLHIRLLTYVCVCETRRRARREG